MYPINKLPPIYDKSESWVEFLGAILSKLNEVIQEVNAYFEIDLDAYVVNLLRPWASADITVDSLDEGSEPTASITQDHNGTHLFLGLPKGDTGLSSYDYAVLNGFTGSLEDFTNDILGYPGAYAAQLAAESARDETEDFRNEIISLNLNHEKYLNWRRLTTNPASFYPVPQSPLYVRASGEPIQSGTGDPAPDNIRPILPWKASGEMVKVQRTGKNLFDGLIEKGIYLTDTGGKYSVDNSLRSVNSIPVIAGETYSSSFKLDGNIHNNTLSLFLYTQSTFVSFKNDNSPIKIPVGVDNITFVYSGVGDTTRLTDIQFEQSSVVTPYEPYSGEEITLTAPQDIYGEWLDNEGRGLITHANIPSYAGESVPTGWKSSVGSLTTGAQVVYPLAVPTALTITPKPFLALPQADRITPRQNVVATDAPTLQTDYAKSPIQEANT